MTTHQDNATRLARIAQITAIVIVIIAVGSFLISMPTQKITSTARGGQSNGANPDGAPAGVKRFEVHQEDWLIALGPLNAHHTPEDQDEIASGQTQPQDGKGPDDSGNELEDNRRLAQRPPIRYLGSLEDTKGFAALIDYAGRQVLLRIGQEFEDEFEITEISEDEITVSDGFDEFTFELTQSSLSSALPTELPNSRTNPNAFPPGSRTPQSNPRNPADQGNPRNPVSPNDDDGGSPA